MTPVFTSNTPMQGLLEDASISFNIRRSDKNRGRFSRKVMLLPSSPRRRSVIPGLMKKKEPALIKELKQFQRWEAVIRHSFNISSSLFSFLWRFRTDPVLGLKSFRAVGPVENRMAKEIMAASKKHKAHLSAFLKPGHIYLVPDAEVAFNSPQRFKQGYARRVLILDVRDSQVLMIPFSTKIERINKTTDILFDSQYRGERLDPNGLPSVENLPLSIFRHKTALFVSAAQPMTREAFIEGALIPLGSVDPALLSVVREKLKNI